MDFNLQTFNHVNDSHDHAGAPDRVSLGQNENAPRHVEAVSAVAPVACGSSWYHDAAIEQASRDAIEASCNPYRAFH